MTKSRQVDSHVLSLTLGTITNFYYLIRKVIDMLSKTSDEMHWNNRLIKYYSIVVLTSPDQGFSSCSEGYKEVCFAAMSHVWSITELLRFELGYQSSTLAKAVGESDQDIRHLFCKIHQTSDAYSKQSHNQRNLVSLDEMSHRIFTHQIKRRRFCDTVMCPFV